MDCGIFESMDAASYSADTPPSDTGNFECNICFELAQEPIVTLCGHLYCWPCLYQWIHLHSHSHECPVCKAIVQEDKLIPLYGRGKTNFDPRSRPIPGITLPNRPVGQRPQTAPRIDTNYIPPNDVDLLTGFMPMAAARFGHMTLSSLFGALPTIFNFQVHGFHDATVYGAISGVPHLFSSSFRGGYGHGFHDYGSFSMEWRPVIFKIVLVILACIMLLHVILA